MRAHAWNTDHRERGMSKKGGSDRAKSLRCKGVGKGRRRKGHPPEPSFGRPPAWFDLGWLPDNGDEADGKTASERFVTRLCRRAFLGIWTLPNPVGKKGKELCDCIVVFDEHVIIISVKDIEYKDTGDEAGFLRWHKAAVDKSVKQIRGAERFLAGRDEVVGSDGRTLALPDQERRRVHRVSVSLGGGGKIPAISVSDDGPRVHIFDDHSVGATFAILPTITDFTNFLVALDELHVPLIMQGGLEDLAALFVRHRGAFFDPADEPHLLVVDDGIFERFMRSPDSKEARQWVGQAWFWTGMLERWAEDHRADGGLATARKVGETVENAPLVQMAREPLEARAILGEALREFLVERTDSRCRVMRPWADVTYVFLAGSSERRDERGKELQARCYIVAAKLRTPTVVGVALDRQGQSTIGYAEDILWQRLPNLSDEDERQADEAIDRYGFFSSIDWKAVGP